MIDLINILNSIHPLSYGLKEHLATVLEEKTIAKKGYLLKAGQVCTTICFIKKGLVRCFYNKDNTEVSNWFMKEGDVIISVESFFKQLPSYESIQVLEDCVMYYISYNELQFMYKNFVEFNFIGRVLTEKYYSLCEQRLFSLRMQRASERYQYLIEHYPELIERVPSKYIASYLSISEGTLSRIRSKI